MKKYALTLQICKIKFGLWNQLGLNRPHLKHISTYTQYTQENA